MLSRYTIDANKAVFIDDSMANIEGSEAAGIKGIHFTDPLTLKTKLRSLGIEII